MRGSEREMGVAAVANFRALVRHFQREEVGK